MGSTTSHVSCDEYCCVESMIKPALSVGLLLTLTCASSHADDNLPFQITMKRSSDRVEVKSENDKVVFTIRSPIGIGSAAIERTTEQWPDKVVTQLRLSGLENFKASTENQKLEASVSSQDGGVRLWMDGKEDSPLDATNPYWMDTRIVGSDGKLTKTIPLKDGYFEMQLPKTLFDGNPKSITLNWIDFYR
jgi:hypothetical protein